MALSVNDAIKRGYFAGCVLLGGENGLERKIKIVSVVEIPDAYLWCKGGELLLTALYSLKDDEKAQINMLENMNKGGAAGIILFNYNSYLNNISKKFISKADELKFPMFKAPGDLTYGEIIKPIMEDLTLDKYKKNMSSFFNDIIDSNISKQHSLENLIKVLAQKLNSSIAIIDHDFSIIETCIRDDLVLSFKNGLIERCLDYYKQKSFVALKDDTLLLDIDDENLVALISCIKDSRGKIIGYLLNVSVTKQILNETNLYLISMSLVICGIQLQNYIKIKEIKRRYEKSFITNLLKGKFESGNEIIERGKLVNLDMHNRYLIIVIKTFNSNGFSKALFDQLYKSIKHNNLKNILVQRTNEIIVIPYIYSYDENVLESKIEEIEHDLIKDIDKQESSNLIIGVGKHYSDLKSLYNSYNEANKVIRWGTMLHSKFSYTLPTPVLHYKDIEYISIIEHIHENATLRAYSDKLLKPIIEYDSYHSIDLLKTMLIHFFEGLDVNKTANRLYIHKNTVNYRLLKIKDLLGTDPFQEGNLVKFCLAVMLQIFG
jgi:purine catabolism regulator